MKRNETERIKFEIIMKWNGTERNGTERNESKSKLFHFGTEQNGTERNGTNRNQILSIWNGTARKGTEWNRTERNESKSKLLQFEIDETKQNQYFVETERNELKRNVTNIM